MEIESRSTTSKATFLDYVIIVLVSVFSKSHTENILNISFFFSLAPQFRFVKFEAMNLEDETSTCRRYSCCNGMLLSSNFIRTKFVSYRLLMDLKR